MGKFLLHAWFPICVDRLFPFQTRNMLWIKVLLKTYTCFMILNIILAGILYSIGGSQAPRPEDPNMRFDECVCFVFTTFHSVAFGDFILNSDGARVIGGFISFYGYFFQMHSFAVILLSQLGGTCKLTILSVSVRMIVILWPSFLLFAAVVIAVGFATTPFLSNRPEGATTLKDGAYFGWCVAFGNTYGEYYPVSNEGRAITGVLDLISWAYKCYAVALLALRKPTLEEHESLLSTVASGNEGVDGLAAVFGPGYIAPSAVAPRVPHATDTEEPA
jgi:hypothetical protein